MYKVDEFKTRFSFEKRLAESARIIEKYPNRLPIIVEVHKSNNKDIILDRHKYLVPNDLTVAQFIYVIRKRVKMRSETALFIFFNNQLPAASETIGNLYKLYKFKDGFLYSIISLENTFG